MGMMNTDRRYGSVAKFFHAIILILVLVMLVVGFFLDDVPKEYKGLVYNAHKLTGLLVLFLMLLRMGWAWINIKPARPFGTPIWQRIAERVVHVLLYCLIIAMPLAGWIGSSSAGKPPHLGDIALGLPIAENKELIDTCFNLHGIIAYAIIVIVSIHAAAALYHHFIKRDDVLRRMF